MKKLLVLAVIPLLLVGCNKVNNDPVRYRTLSFDVSNKVQNRDGKTMKFQERERGARIGKGKDDFFINLSKEGGDFVFSHYVTKFESITLSFSTELNRMPFGKILFMMTETKKDDSIIYSSDEFMINSETVGNDVVFNNPYSDQKTGGCYFAFAAELVNAEHFDEYDDWYQVRTIQFNNITVTHG